jgi:hypothetical protein
MVNKNALAQSTLIGAITTILFVALITIAGELYKVTGVDGKSINPIKEFLKSLHGHHWVGKGIWALALFIIVSGILYVMSRNHTNSNRLGCIISTLSWTLVIGTLVLFGFFMYEF